jgi:hypothetical protein
MALTKVIGSGVEGITNLSNATFLSVNASEVATLLTSAVINSEGGAATTNIAQGLCKAWVNFTGVTTTAARDSVNISGLTDVATAKTTVAYTNNMGNTNYTGSYFQTGSTERLITSFNNHYTGGFGARTTSSCGVHSYIGTGAGDVADNDVLIFGDLA